MTINPFINENLRGLRFMHHQPSKIAELEIIALRTGMAGESGFERQRSNKPANEIHQSNLIVTAIGDAR
jgi:glycine cleavage system aminomethyltransferase T